MALSSPDMEAVWTNLAARLSALADGQESLFLSKLVLLLANEFGSADEVNALIESAALDL